MSWHKCVTAESYSLAVPAPVLLMLWALHLLAWLSSICLDLSSGYVVLIWIVVRRSWRQVCEYADRHSDRVFRVDAKGRFHIHEASRRSLPATGNFLSWWTTLLTRTDGVAGESCIDRQLHRNNLEAPGQGSRRHYTCCRSVRMPGCAALTLVREHGKPLEILVFYRYDQRQFYRRLLRHLSYQ